LLGTPKYLAGEMTLGSLMQAATAFAQVQIALNWLADNAMRLADWFASARRVSQLNSALSDLEDRLGSDTRAKAISKEDSPDDSVHLRNVSISLPDGRLVIDEADAILKPGEKVLVRGDSGTGKSTLIRAMAGLWPWGSGQILMPSGADVAFLPQRPYFPLGTLRSLLAYPRSSLNASDDQIITILKRCGLEHLVSQLDVAEQWSAKLSGGEQQRLAFARILLSPPDILIMDEPTSALDEISQERILTSMVELLPNTTVIHAGHRPGIVHFHNREIRLTRETSTGPATTKEGKLPRRDIARRALNLVRRRRRTG
jgi:putative ATP-binding cassette transporter